MRLQFAPEHNNTANLADFPHEPQIKSDLDFSAEFTANGVAKKIGGGTMEVEWSYLTQDEFVELLQFFGVSHRAPSREGTFVLPDWFRIYSYFNGQITIETPSRDNSTGLFRNVKAVLSGLDYI